MKKTISIVAICISIALNILFGFMYFKGVVYQAGINAGLAQADMQLGALIEGGQIIIPEQENNG